MIDDYKIAGHAVCCLMLRKDGRVLAISRGNNTDAWGLPGGKVEPNESLDVAVVRETFEETGFVIAAPQPVYTGFVPGETDYVCTTFVARLVAQAPDAPRSLPFEGQVSWLAPRVLAEGPFGEYNRALFRHLNIEWRGPDEVAAAHFRELL